MIIQSIVVIAFILIIVSLGSALFHIVKHKTHENSEKTAKALTLRISLSLALFLFLFLAMMTGWLKPHGIGSVMHSGKPTRTESTSSD